MLSSPACPRAGVAFLLVRPRGSLENARILVEHVGDGFIHAAAAKRAQGVAE